MSKYRKRPPSLDGGVFLTDGGLETDLVFNQGVELPCFAAFVLLRSEEGTKRLYDYYRQYIPLAIAKRWGFVLESPTWRANRDWAEKLGYTPAQTAEANRAAIALMRKLRDEFETPAAPMPISGCVGPRGDGYDPGAVMTPEEAQAYHAEQIETFADTDADFVSAITMTNTEEAIGIARAAKAAGMPSVISFTVETDGRLPTGQTLADAIDAVDAATSSAPAYYMINCAHPTHFSDALAPGADWVKRIRGLRANASKCSHEELDNAETLDDGDPAEFGDDYRALVDAFPHLNVFGGCCGTDYRHVACVSAAITPV